MTTAAPNRPAHPAADRVSSALTTLRNVVAVEREALHVDPHPRVQVEHVGPGVDLGLGHPLPARIIHSHSRHSERGVVLDDWDCSHHPADQDLRVMLPVCRVGEDQDIPVGVVGQKIDPILLDDDALLPGPLVQVPADLHVEAAGAVELDTRRSKKLVRLFVALHRITSLSTCDAMVARTMRAVKWILPLSPCGRPLRRACATRSMPWSAHT